MRKKILWANFKKIRCTNIIRKLTKFAEQNKTKLFVNSNDVIVRMIIAFAVVFNSMIQVTVLL